MKVFKLIVHDVRSLPPCFSNFTVTSQTKELVAMLRFCMSNALNYEQQEMTGQFLHVIFYLFHLCAQY